MEGDSGLDVFSNDGILDIIPPNEYDPFEVGKYVLNSRKTSCYGEFSMAICDVRYSVK
jgi:hypothetical protein